MDSLEPQETSSQFSLKHSSKAALPTPTTSFARRISPYVSIARPGYWVKNAFMALGVLLAFFYHPESIRSQTILPILWAVATTCLIASSNYVLNEILDAPTDRQHPVKRLRPVALGIVRLSLAYAEWVLLGAIGLFMASLLNWPFFFSSLSLLIMGVLYNVPPIRTKELPYLDVLSEALNNPIRLLLGWYAVSQTEIPPISLLISYWMIGAFFMAAKRFAEYRFMGNSATAAAYRSSFKYYSERSLILSMFFYTTCFAVFLGIFIVRYHIELIFFVPLVAGFVSYYLGIAFKEESAAQSPEQLYREKGLMAYLALCLLAFVVLMLIEIPALYTLFNVPPSQVPALWKIE